jgi:hypothetical protein
MEPSSHWVNVVFFYRLSGGLSTCYRTESVKFFHPCNGCLLFIKQYKRTHAGELNYFRALAAIGVSSSFIGTSTFVLFVFLYLKIDQSLMQSIIESESMGPYLNEYTATFAVWVEGIFSGFIMTFILINFLTDQKE